ncbi:Hsp70 family protein, partial [Streptomyces sp. 2MCAF27]
SADIAELERLLELTRDLHLELKRASGELEYELLTELSRLRHVRTPRDEAKAAIAQGKRAVAARDRAALADVIQRLYEMVPPELIKPGSPIKEFGGVKKGAR